MPRPLLLPDDTAESLLSRMEADRDLGTLSVDEALEYAKLIAEVRIGQELEDKLEEMRAAEAAAEFDTKMSAWKMEVALKAMEKIHDAADELGREVMGALGQLFMLVKRLPGQDSADVQTVVELDAKLGELITEYDGLTVRYDLRRCGKRTTLFEAVAGELDMDGPPDE